MTPAVEVCPVDADAVPEVAQFLHENLNGRLSAEGWQAAIVPPWRTAEPTHGLCLRQDGRVVGAYVAFYSERVIGGRQRRVCNLAAWCVLDGFGAQGLRLLRGLLASGCDVFTDLSPSGSVVPIDRRLGFQQLDTTTDLRPAYPIWTRRARLVSDVARVAELVTGRDAEIFEDHREARAVRHVVLLVGDRPCYVMYRRVRRKGLPVFASLVHVSDAALFVRGVGRFGIHLLRNGMPLLLAERRVVGARIPHARTVQGRPKLFRGTDLAADAVDDLYSEITCVMW